jgi:Na+/H+-dicarboxylate symporter
MNTDNRKKKKLSLSSQIMIGMGLGFGVGIFFGEYCAFLQIIGNAFIKLLQITILPYIIVSMILGIGGLTVDQAKLMVKKAGILMLLFILFAAWFSGSTFSLMQYPTFVFAGLLSFFGGVDVAMPFMLDLMRIPADLYQLYVVTGIINGRFATLLAAMNLVIFTLLATASLTGVMAVNKKKLTHFYLMPKVARRGHYSIPNFRWSYRFRTWPKHPWPIRLPAGIRNLPIF